MQGFVVNAQVWLKNNDNTRPGTDHHFVEYQADISRTFGATTAKLLALYSPDFYGATRRSTWVEFSLAQKLSAQWTLNGGIGARSTQPAKNYRDWNLGAVWSVLPKTSLDFHYYDTDEHRLGKNYDGRFIATLAQKF
ncbi:MAG: TorF family putative porin, partial [Asticcacaulis sp.]